MCAFRFGPEIGFPLSAERFFKSSKNVDSSSRLSARCRRSFVVRRCITLVAPLFLSASNSHSSRQGPQLPSRVQPGSSARVLAFRLPRDVSSYTRLLVARDHPSRPYSRHEDTAFMWFTGSPRNLVKEIKDSPQVSHIVSLCNTFLNIYMQ